MPATIFTTTPRSAARDPYGSYRVWPTQTGICFQVSAHYPGNKWLLSALILKSLVLAAFTYNGVLPFLASLLLLLALDALFYLAVRRVLLVWIEVRPDGLSIWPDASQPDCKSFFDRRDITQRQLDFEGGLTFRYGIHDVQATPPFACTREFDIFTQQFEQAVSRLWHQQNL
jgi:hypothetical protein